MNNEPVAWINKTGSHGYLEWDKDDEVDESIPLYTHPVNTCKHGVDDGACKECYIEVTNPANPYQSITDTKIEPTVVSYTHPAELTAEPVAWRTHYPSGWEYKDGNPPFELKGNSQLLYTHPVKELTDEEIEELIWNTTDMKDFARAILRKAQENG
jgi:hypothetical protein